MKRGHPEPRRGEPARELLRERMKELRCVYGIARVAAAWGRDFEQDVRDIVALLPPAWQHPEAAARITIDGREYATPGFALDGSRQAADVVVAGVGRGCVEVVYVRPQPAADEGPFLREERDLIETVADLLGLLVERRDAAEARARIDDQMRQADQLATIGLLAAGVAHELNEPLSAILGFAQLLKRSEALPEQEARDVARIVSGALYARDVIRKLLLFARRAPASKTEIDLEADVVIEVLSFFEDRCAKDGVEMVWEPAGDLPRILGDAAQLKQVLINLVVNALQAMPRGGTLTVRTAAVPKGVLLVVEDTGAGMPRDVQQRIFLPFFTTKGHGQGTGLGLAVVHGIVTDHRGDIRVESRPGRGSRFEVALPVRGREEGGEGGEEGRDAASR